MKISSFLSMIVIGLMLGGCVTKGQTGTQVASNFIYQQHVIPTTHQIYAAKDAKNITVFNEAPATPYKVIGIATVAKSNLLGIPRKDETVHSMMKELAASIGGDAVINMNDNGKNQVQGNVIQFRKILI